MFVKNGDSVYTTRKSTMYHFFSTLRTTLDKHKTLGLAILVILGIIGGSSLVVQQLPSAYTAAGCALYNSSSGGGAIVMGSISSAAAQALTQVNQFSNMNKNVLDQNICAAKMLARTNRTSLSQSEVMAMINRVFGPYSWGALNVARCESGLNPSAYNPISIGGSHPAGLFQILYPSTWVGTPEAAYSPYDAMANTLAAYSIFARDGYSWREWSCRP
jgi:hypothetical protein